MSSEKQIEANQANAQKSTGPTSTAGLEKSSRNATRHGLLARTIVLDRENKDRFDLLLSTLLEEFQPTTTAEGDLVENMAIARWRLMRLWGIERATFDNEMKKQEADSALIDPANPHLSPSDVMTQAANAFRVLSNENRSFEVMSRYEARFERLYSRSLDRLIKLREKRLFAKRSQFLEDDHD